MSSGSALMRRLLTARAAMAGQFADQVGQARRGIGPARGVRGRGHVGQAAAASASSGARWPARVVGVNVGVRDHEQAPAASKARALAVW